MVLYKAMGIKRVIQLTTRKLSLTKRWKAHTKVFIMQIQMRKWEDIEYKLNILTETEHKLLKIYELMTKNYEKKLQNIN